MPDPNDFGGPPRPQITSNAAARVIDLGLLASAVYLAVWLWRLPSIDELTAPATDGSGFWVQPLPALIGWVAAVVVGGLIGRYVLARGLPRFEVPLGGIETTGATSRLPVTPVALVAADALLAGGLLFSGPMVFSGARMIRELHRQQEIELADRTAQVERDKEAALKVAKARGDKAVEAAYDLLKNAKADNAKLMELKDKELKELIRKKAEGDAKAADELRKKDEEIKKNNEDLDKLKPKPGDGGTPATGQPKQDDPNGKGGDNKADPSDNTKGGKGDSPPTGKPEEKGDPAFEAAKAAVLMALAYYNPALAAALANALGVTLGSTSESVVDAAQAILTAFPAGRFDATKTDEALKKLRSKGSVKAVEAVKKTADTMAKLETDQNRKRALEEFRDQLGKLQAEFEAGPPDMSKDVETAWGVVLKVKPDATVNAEFLVKVYKQINNTVSNVNHDIVRAQVLKYARETKAVAEAVLKDAEAKMQP